MVAYEIITCNLTKIFLVENRKKVGWTFIAGHINGIEDVETADVLNVNYAEG
jgi:hypothetical protein